MRLHDLVATSRAVAAASARTEKIRLLAELLGRLEPAEIPIAIGFLTGWPRQGKLGAGWATVAAARPGSAAECADLSLAEVDALLESLKGISGARSGAERKRVLGSLLERCTAEEQDFVRALLLGEVRQGALEGVLLEAVAKAARLPADRVRRAVMLAGDLGAVASAVLEHGSSALEQYRLELFRPVQPMLADSAGSLEGALAELGTAVLEWKLDGARIQVHRRNDRVAVYTRSLNEVTGVVPQVVAAVRGLPARELILDGEAIALSPDGRPLPFQDTMRRFSGKGDPGSKGELAPFFFDLLLQDGEDLLDVPLTRRLAQLDAVLPSELRVPRIVTAELAAAQSFQADALARGHEGIMAKAPDAPYAAGRRGSAWLKLKSAHTLDLVVLAAEWGSGRRKGWLSNLHLGARDPAGGFVMLGKTFKGMTDQMLEWQTRELLAREVRREGHIVWVKPELVVEVAFNDVQRSSHYPGGVALRFARIKGYRQDKGPEAADTIEAVKALERRLL